MALSVVRHPLPIFGDRAAARVNGRLFERQREAGRASEDATPVNS